MSNDRADVFMKLEISPDTDCISHVLALRDNCEKSMARKASTSKLAQRSSTVTGSSAVGTPVKDLLAGKHC